MSPRRKGRRQPRPRIAGAFSWEAYRRSVGALRQFQRADDGDRLRLSFGFIDYNGRPHHVACEIGKRDYERDVASFGYFKDGSYQGMRTFMKRLPSGVNWALLYNAGMEFDPQDRDIAAGTVQEVRKLVEGLGKYPDVDLFKEFP